MRVLTQQVPVNPPPDYYLNEAIDVCRNIDFRDERQIVQLRSRLRRWAFEWQCRGYRQAVADFTAWASKERPGIGIDIEEGWR